MTSGKLLEGFRVVECGIYMALPSCGRLLCELGAEVIKVETMRSLDPCYWIPSFAPSVGQTEFQGQKRRVLLNVGLPKAKPIFEELLRRSDMFITNYRRDVLAKWGFSFERIREINPSIIVLWQTGMGSNGPHADYKVFGNIAQQTTGVTSITGFPSSDIPNIINTSYSDYHAGIFQSTALIAALLRRKHTGEGAFLECSIFKSGAVTVGPAFLDYQANGRAPKRMGNHDLVAAPHSIYPCRGDDNWCAIAVFDDTEWEALCRVIGNPDWVKQAKFATLQARLANQDELDAFIGEWTKDKDAFEVMRLMQAAGVAAGVVYKGEHLAQCKHLRERGAYQDTTYYVPDAKAPPWEWPESKPIISSPVPIKFSETPIGLGHIHRIGEDNQYVYGDILGMRSTEIEALTEEGVLR